MGAILRVRDENGNIIDIPAIKGDKGEQGIQGEKGDKGDKGEKGDAGANGQRGTGILKVTTTPTTYTTTTGGKTPSKRMSISTIKSQSGVSEVLVGDVIECSSMHYHIYYLDATYAYIDIYQSIQGDDGADGKTPIKGTDYFTAADKQEMVDSVLAALPKWNGGTY